jgi:hypothetical protein
MPANYLNTYRLFPVQKPAELERVLIQTYTDISHAMNFKENGQYELIETQNCQQFYHDPATATPDVIQNKRFAFRKCIELGPIATGAVVDIAHGIALIVDTTRIYGTVKTDAPDWRPIPCVGPWGTDLLSVFVTSTNIHIESGQTFPNILSGRVILEYFKN